MRAFSVSLSMSGILLAVLLTVYLFATTSAPDRNVPAAIPTRLDASAPFTSTAWVYMPVMMSPPRSVRRVNVPYLPDINFDETAIFWFGSVNLTDNYSDVRVGYTGQELVVHVAVFDRRLWYDTAPSAGDLTQWDSATLYLDTTGNTGSAPGSNSYRFDAQLNDGQVPRTPWQAAYRGNGSGWIRSSVLFTTTSGYRWESSTVGGINNNQNNRGWVMDYYIPFTSLGPANSPAQGTVWGMAVALHDRDDAAGTPIKDQGWPETLDVNRPSTWGQLHFGLPVYTPPASATRGTVTIRHKLNGATVADAAVGGTMDNLCPGDSDYIWNQWGNANFAGASGFNIQNQSDVGDWPCFAKYYVTFPLTALPPGKVIVSATLTLHEFGGSDPSQARPSLIQVFTVAEDWDERTLTWNNAPLALENVSRAWVDPMPGCGSTIPWPCVARTWDVSYAVAQAYLAGQPLRLAMYEADSHYHSGKYFTSSDAEDWNAEGRPTLIVTWGTPP